MMRSLQGNRAAKKLLRRNFCEDTIEEKLLRRYFCGETSAEKLLRSRITI
jgi:hypothetical protein